MRKYRQRRPRAVQFADSVGAQAQSAPSAQPMQQAALQSGQFNTTTTNDTLRAPSMHEQLTGSSSQEIIKRKQGLRLSSQLGIKG